jgi:hypothetical protein
MTTGECFTQSQNVGKSLIGNGYAPIVRGWHDPRSACSTGPSIMKRKLHLSLFDIPAPERIKIRITRLIAPAESVSPEPRVPANSSNGSRLVLTRTFARGNCLEGKLRSIAQ